MTDTQHTPEDDMKLPENRTCSDCHNFFYCVKMYGVKEHYTTCDFSPSKFSLSYLNLFEKEKKINAELLEALKELQTQIQQVSDGDRPYTGFDTELIDEAIAKATGAS